MIKPAVLDAMVAAGCSAEQIAAAVKADQAGSTNAERQARFRARRKALLVTENNVTGVTVTDQPPALDKEKSPTPPKEIKPTPLPPVVSAREQFAEFWKLFPNKVGKRDAEREFGFALQRSSFDEIMDGLCRYVGKRDDRPWCNPSTFLHQDRWADQPADQPRRQNGHSPPNGKRMNAVEAMLSLQAERENEQTSRTVNYGDDEFLPPDKPGLPRLAGDLGQVVEWPVRQRDYQRG